MAEIDWTRIAGPLAQAGGTILGSVIGGPAGAVLGPVIGQAVGQALGVDPTPEAIGGALAAPEAREKILRVDSAIGPTYKVIAERLDVQDAREQTMELTRQGSAIAWSATIISVVVVAGFFSMLTMMVSRAIPSNEMTMMMLGTLTAAFTQVLNYWLGSSKGSADKTAAIEAMARKGAR